MLINKVSLAAMLSMFRFPQRSVYHHSDLMWSLKVFPASLTTCHPQLIPGQGEGRLGLLTETLSRSRVWSKSSIWEHHLSTHHEAVEIHLPVPHTSRSRRGNTTEKPASCCCLVVLWLRATGELGLELLGVCATSWSVWSPECNATLQRESQADWWSFN